MLSKENTAAATTLATRLANESAVESLRFGIIDYVVFFIMLACSTAIGIYFGFFSKSKNTTEEYLRGGKKMKTLPIAISLVASQLSGISIMSVPAESYTYGFNYVFLVLAMVPTVPLLMYIIVPVFYENNISNCYEYLELRFNKRTRQLVTATFIMNAFLMVPVYMFVPSLAFSQVTGVNIHLINTIVSSICVFYTMLGGIKAVVWTDVVQGGIMLLSVVLVAVLGISKVGGLGTVLERAYLGGRLNVDFSLDPRVRMTVWSAFSGSILMWAGHIGLNQSCVQRIVSLPSISHAKKSLFIAGIGIVVIMGFNFFTGIIMFARYYGCDPMLAGLVSKADKMMPFFVQDIMGHLLGMPGIFISCVFSAALSTLSANLNSLAGVIYFDLIKPRIRHTEARANMSMRIFIILMGLYCIAGGFVVQNFDSILQTAITITGINTGAVVGVFMLGMFVPRVNAKVTTSAFFVSVIGMLWIIINAQLNFKAGRIQYTPLPNSLDRCEAHNLHNIIKLIQNTTTPIATTTTATMTTPMSPLLPTTEPRITTAFGSNRDFSLYDVTFYLYKCIGVSLVFLWAVPMSYVWRSDDHEKQNPLLYSPFVRKFLKLRITELEEMPLKQPLPLETTEISIAITEKSENGVKREI